MQIYTAKAFIMNSLNKLNEKKDFVYFKRGKFHNCVYSKSAYFTKRVSTLNYFNIVTFQATLMTFKQSVASFALFDAFLGGRSNYSTSEIVRKYQIVYKLRGQFIFSITFFFFIVVRYSKKKVISDI